MTSNAPNLLMTSRYDAGERADQTNAELADGGQSAPGIPVIQSRQPSEHFERFG